ncbi:phosphotransferase [Sulfurimonas sp. SAG-AH-194-I05]|nr:phosphotransferase [Sulfurimonas sp. SAG-AH-194-I05]MDF1875322.1 phosphotransferase [Sulfurimonas sp. SAG-AH-194-I05]
MGVITNISLHEVQSIFPKYNFTHLVPTLSGIIDTTYIVSNEKESYILKKYERNIPQKVEQDKAYLQKLHMQGLNVPLCLDANKGWYLYLKLKGKQPKNIKSYHIQALARFLAKLHMQTQKNKCISNSIMESELLQALHFTKQHYFSYYKRFVFLKHFTLKTDALIHGDIFKDNTIFNGKKIGVIDFIDAACGTFAYDAAVALVGFDARKHHHYFINLFLNTYNQHAPKKITKEKLLYKMKIASHYYALKRVYTYKNTFRAKELLK